MPITITPSTSSVRAALKFTHGEVHFLADRVINGEFRLMLVLDGKLTTVWLKGQLVGGKLVTGFKSLDSDEFNPSLGAEVTFAGYVSNSGGLNAVAGWMGKVIPEVDGMPPLEIHIQDYRQTERPELRWK